MALVERPTLALQYQWKEHCAVEQVRSGQQRAGDGGMGVDQAQGASVVLVQTVPHPPSQARFANLDPRRLELVI